MLHNNYADCGTTPHWPGTDDLICNLLKVFLCIVKNQFQIHHCDETKRDLYRDCGASIFQGIRERLIDDITLKTKGSMMSAGVCGEEGGVLAIEEVEAGGVVAVAAP